MQARGRGRGTEGRGIRFRFSICAFSARVIAPAARHRVGTRGNALACEEAFML
jgi:hypothetical protein